MADGKVTDQAEQLRLQGNDAFGLKDWKGAIEIYQASIEIDADSKNSAKVYSNLAVALCKISRYDDAADAAEKATQVDPDWSKAWWRRGVVAELQKNFMRALSHYEKATGLSPNEPVFVKGEYDLRRKGLAKG